MRHETNRRQQFLNDQQQQQQQQQQKQHASLTVTVKSASNTSETLQNSPARDPNGSLPRNHGNQRDSVSSITSVDNPDASELRRTSVVRLPPLSHEKGSSLFSAGERTREGSGNSVTSARKVNVDVPKSHKLGSRGKVRDVPS